MAVKKKAAPKAAPSKAPAARKTAKAPAKAAGKAVSPAAAPAASGSRKGLYITIGLVGLLAALGLQAVYVAKAKEAMKFDFIRGGKILGQGLADGQGTGPRSIAGDAQGNVFFLDGQDRSEMRLQKFDKNLDFVAKYKPKKVEGAMTRSQEVDVDAQGTVYVLNGDNRVLVLDNNLNFLRAFPVAVAEASAMAVSNEGLIYIASRADNKIQVFGNDGHPVTEFGAPGSNSGDVAAPVRLACDAKGDLVVLEDLPESPRIKVFDKDHKVLKEFRALGVTMTPPLRMGVDNQNRLFMNEPGKSCVMVYRLDKGKQIGQVQGTNQGDLFVAPGSVAANRYTGAVFVHTIPGLIPCAMPAGH